MPDRSTILPPADPEGQRRGLVRSLLRPFREMRAPRPAAPIAVEAPDPSSAPGVAPLTAPALEHVMSQVRQNYEPTSNTFDDYRRLVLALEEIDALDILPVHEFAGATSTDRRLLALRHDVDGDPVTGLRMARFLASRGIGGSFYLLPTAAYYGFRTGFQKESAFIRRPELEAWVRGFVVAGCEIGLHNDALATYLDHGVDPAVTLEEEIAWLRSLGAVIRGSVAHNSAPAYGAANSEVFTGRQLWSRDPLSHDGRALPVETVDEASLGLTYEGTFAVPRAVPDAEAAHQFCYDRAGGGLRSEAWMRRFLLDNPTCDWAVDLQVWVIGRNEWVVAGRRGEEVVFDWCVSQRGVVDRITSMPPGTRCLVVLHPEYFLR